MRWFGLMVGAALLVSACAATGTSPSPSPPTAAATATPSASAKTSFSPPATIAPPPDATPAPPAATPTPNPTPTAKATPTPTPTPRPSTAAATPRPPCDSTPVLSVKRVLDGGRPCFGRNSIRVRGWLAESWGIGGLKSGIIPSWLGEMPAGPVLWQRPGNPDGCIDDDDCVFVFIHVRPGSGVVLGKKARWVTLTGHFDDQVARTCAWDGHTNSSITRAKAVRVCRDAFVVTSIRNAPTP